MKHYTTREVPARTQRVLERTTCDLCGIEIKRQFYRVDEVEMSYKSGSSYPEGGSGTELSFDICPACFESKVVPWMRSQGATPTETEWDY